MPHVRTGNPRGRPRGRKLTVKQSSFVDHYMTLGVASKACLAAGYNTINPVRQGTELLQNPAIKEEIERRRVARMEKSEVTVEYLTQKLLEIIAKEQDENPQAALRAIELAGKSIAMFKERQEISGPDGEAIRINEQRVQEEADAFKSRIASMAKRGGEGEVLKFPKPGSSGSS